MALKVKAVERLLKFDKESAAAARLYRVTAIKRERKVNYEEQTELKKSRRRPYCEDVGG